MSRDDGFAIADVDVRLLTDPKIKRLVRLCPDEATAARAAIAYVGLILDCWAAGERATLEDTAPPWISDVTPSGRTCSPRT